MKNLLLPESGVQEGEDVFGCEQGCSSFGDVLHLSAEIVIAICARGHSASVAFELFATSKSARRHAVRSAKRSLSTTAGTVVHFHDTVASVVGAVLQSI